MDKKKQLPGGVEMPDWASEEVREYFWSIPNPSEHFSPMFALSQHGSITTTAMNIYHGAERGAKKQKQLHKSQLATHRKQREADIWHHWFDDIELVLRKDPSLKTDKDRILKAREIWQLKRAARKAEQDRYIQEQQSQGQRMSRVQQKKLRSVLNDIGDIEPRGYDAMRKRLWMPNRSE